MTFFKWQISHFGMNLIKLDHHYTVQRALTTKAVKAGAEVHTCRTCEQLLRTLCSINKKGIKYQIKTAQKFNKSGIKCKRKVSLQNTFNKYNIGICNTGV